MAIALNLVMEGNLQLLTVGEIKQLDLSRGLIFQGIFVLKRKARRTARNGSIYWMLEFGDKSGNFRSTCFGDHPLHPRLEAIAEDSPVLVKGVTNLYQGDLSPNLSEIRPLTEEELRDPSLLQNLVETCLEDPEELWDELEETIGKIGHEAIRKTVEMALKEVEAKFRSAPAALKMHHAYRHGLLEHTVHMARAAIALLPLYEEVDPDLALAGVILHDIGKSIEYEGELSPNKSKSGILQGHVVLGYRLARKAGILAKLSPGLLERLEHIILSHQGELEWGAASLTATPEAVFVSMVDNLDARMGMVQYALRHRSEDKIFSEYIGGLKTTLLTEPISQEYGKTPEPQGDLDL